MPQREEVVGPPDRRRKRKVAVSGSNEVQHDNFFAEEIQLHKIYENGSVELLVQWKDSNGTSLKTWEVEDGLEDSPALEEYFVRLGGRDRLFKKHADKVRRGLRGRKSDSPLVPARRSPRFKTAALAKSTEWSPPERSWEQEIASIDGCEVEGGTLAVYVSWETGHRTRHDASVLYKNCPQKMLRFYEKHIKIIEE